MAEPNPNLLDGATDEERIKDLCSRTYKAQAVWFLNAFWDEGIKEESETIWLYVHKFQDIDEEKKAAGCAVDELNAHRFLEHFKETQTVMEMRTNLREVGAIPKTGRPKAFPLTHFLICKFKKDWKRLVNAAQGDNSGEIREAQEKLDAVQVAFDEADRTAKLAAAALKDALAREAEAKKAEAEAKTREAEAHASAEQSKKKEAELKSAQAEVEAALAEVKAQEDAYNAKTDQLKAKSEAGGVSGMRAKNELAQHLGEDPLPLRKAKITQEAAVKKAERATKAAQQAREKAEEDARQASAARASSEQAAREAEAARASSEQAAREAEQAVAEAQAAVKEAEEFLEYVKSKPGCAHGAIFWMERELHEKKKYMPVAKGGISK